MKRSTSFLSSVKSVWQVRLGSLRLQTRPHQVVGVQPGKSRTQKWAMALVVLGVFTHHTTATTIFPIATTGLGAFAVFDGTNYLVGIQGDEVVHANVTAQLFGPTGALIGPRIKVGRTGGLPSAAFDGTNYLLVWDDAANYPNDDIYGQLVSRSGALVGSPFPICTAPGMQDLTRGGPPIAFGAGKYLVVWRDGRSGTNASYARLVLASGGLFGSEIPISADALPAEGGSVAFDGTDFLVAFQKQTSGSGVQYATYGMLISPSGTTTGPFLISQTTSTSPPARNTPSGLVFDGTNYLVVWSRDVGPGSPSASDFDIYGRFVSPAGVPVGNETAFITGKGDQSGGVPVFDGANYLVGGIDGTLGSSNSVTKVQFFNPVGQAIGPSFAPLAAFPSQGVNKALFGGAVFDGARFVIVGTVGRFDTNGFTGAGVYGTFMPKSTTPPRLDVAGPLVTARLPLLLTGTPGINYSIQVSTSLAQTNWTTLVTNSPTNGTFIFTDAGATNESRFYRAVKQ